MSSVGLNRLKKRSDFLKVGKSSLKYNCPFFIIKATLHSNSSSINAAVGFTVTKKVGKAVIRNRIKRQLRVLCALLKDYFLFNHAYVIIVRSAFTTLSFEEMQGQLKRSLQYLQRKTL